MDAAGAEERARRKAEAVAAGWRQGFVGAMGAAGVALVVHSLAGQLSPAYRRASAYPKRIVAALAVAGASGYFSQRVSGDLAKAYGDADVAASAAADEAARGGARPLRAASR